MTASPPHASPLAGVRAVLFDMDGVVVDNAHIHAAAWAECARDTLGLTIAPDDHRIHGGRNAEIIEALTGTAPSMEAALAFHTLKEERYRTLALGRLEMVPGLTAYLDHLSGLGLPVALVTSADRVNVAFGLSALRLEARFLTRVTGEDVGRGKPDPEPYLLGAARLGVDPAACLVHEDAPVGVRSGVAAGARVAALTTTVPAEALFEAGARWVVPDFTAWLERLG